MANPSVRALCTLFVVSGLAGSCHDRQGDDMENETSVTAPGEATLRDRLVGTWTLVSHTTFRDGTGVDTGTHPKGLLIYTAEGHMTVAISFDEGVADPAKNIFYAGTFSVERDAVVHHVEISNDPARVGTRQPRNVRFEDDRLALRAGDEKRGGVIVWRRATGL